MITDRRQLRPRPVLLAVLLALLGSPPAALVAQSPTEAPLTLPVAEELPAPKPAVENLSEKQVRDIVEKYLKEQAEKKKQEEEAKKKESEARGIEVGSQLDFTTAMWKDGPWFETKNKDFSAAFHGRFDVDFAGFAAGRELQDGPGGVGDLKDGGEFRRARLRMDGTAYDIFFWVAEFDFAFAQDGTTKHPGLTDVYWDVMRLPLLGTFRVGHMREPFSMESLTSGLALPFLERSSAFEAFCPFRNLGMMCMNSVLEDRATWALGAFRTNSRNNGNPSDFGDGEFALTGRVTCLPWVDAETYSLFHLGAAFSHRGFNVDDDPVRLRNFCGIRTGNYIFADTGELPAEGTELANVEAALKLGPLVLQGEGYFAQVRNAVIDDVTRDPSFYGWYVQATWLLTGEDRPYRRSVPTTNPAVFDRPRPYENFFFVQSDDEGRWWERLALGRGAWEIGARYCYVDLNDPSQGVDAQTYHDITLGLNWYLTINTKMQFNYIIAYRDFPSEDNQGTANIFAVRFHHDF